MILTCPECKSRYVVNPTVLLPNGRTVRCAKCKNTWFEKKPKEDVEMIPSDDENVKSDNTQNPEKNINNNNSDNTEIEEDFDFPISQPRKRKRPIPKGSNLPALQNQKYGSGKMGWISLVIFLTAIISLFLIFQESISSSWPASKKLYAAIGLDGAEIEVKPEAPYVDPIEERLVIGGLAPRRENINGVANLVIAGHVENISDSQQDIPDLRIRLLDERNTVLREWSFQANQTFVNTGEKVAFETSLPNSPNEARDISVTFATN
ncbi:MAG: DUF3426 domain-containing protein [Kordiimonadaceae bacterium]|nr:DUF3426 domain-containing protein [Kordiimonadaceae bacterium]